MPAPHGRKALALIAMAWLLLFTVMVREDWVARAVATERRDAEQWLGPALAAEVCARGQRWFDATLVDSGVIADVYALFTVPASERAADADFGSAVPWFDAWFERRLAALFALAGQAFLRASNVLLWLPYGLLLAAPCVLDGLMRRQIRRSNFDYCSPLVYRGGIAALEFVGVAMLLSLFAPWALPVWTIPALLVLSALGGGAIAANLQKEV